MISKKLRNVSMICLSLILAVSLAFGISSFSSTKKADAAEATVSVNFNAWYTSNSSALSAKPTSISFDSNGYLTSTDGKNDYVSYTTTLISDYLKYNKSGSTIASGDLYGLTTNTSHGKDNPIQLQFVLSKKSSVKILYGLDSSNFNSSFSATSTGANSVSFPHNAVTQEITVGGLTVSPYSSNTTTKGKLRYAEIELNAGTTAFALDPAYMCDAAGGSSRKIYLYAVEVTPLVNTYTVTFKDGDTTIDSQTIEENNTATAPENLSKTGYNFKGWSLDGSNVVTVSEQTINEDTTFTAIWEKDASYVKPTISSFVSIADINVDYGSDKNDIKLPETVKGQDAEGTEYDIPVTWLDLGSVDTSVLTTYTLTGTIDSNVYDKTAELADPTVNIVITEIKVNGGTLSGTYYTFDNATVVGLPTTYTENGVDFTIKWDAYVENSATITGSLVEKEGYDVSAATVTANVEKAESASSSIIFDNISDVSETFKNAGMTFTGTWTYEKSESNVTANNLEYMGIKGNLATITMYLDRPATVTIGAAGNSSSALTLNGETVKSGVQAVIVKSYELNAGAHTLESTVEGKNIFIKFINIQYEDSTEFIGYSNEKFSTQANDAATLPVAPTTVKEGYSFIGWSNGSGVYAPGTVITSIEHDAQVSTTVGYMGTVYKAVYAKAEYKGVSFRKSETAPAVRFGHVLTIVDAENNAINGLTLTASGVFTVKNLTKNLSADVEFAALNIAYNESAGGYLTNLAITGMDAEKSQNALKVDVKITINGVTITSESTATAADTIVSKAAIALEKGYLNATEAAIYGVSTNA